MKVTTKKKLREYLDQNVDKDGKYIIKFDIPSRNGKAIMHIIRTDEPSHTSILIVNCFYWRQTIDLRRDVGYGSNMDCRELDWEEMWTALLNAALRRRVTA